MTLERPENYRFHNGTKAVLPFAAEEYEDRLAGLRDIMEMHSLDAVVLTSMHNVAYYSGFLYCSFGRPYACVVTKDACITVSAGIDAGQPWRRSHGDNITYTDWQRDNFWRVVAGIVGTGKAVGCEADHLTLLQSEKLNHFLAAEARRGRGTGDDAAAHGQERCRSGADPAGLPGGRCGRLRNQGGGARRACARSTWQWRGATRWRRRSRNGSPTPSTAIPGSGSSRG